MKVTKWITASIMASAGYAFQSVPFLMASHKLVKGIKPIEHELEVNSRDHVTDLVKKLITSCSSDEYLLVNIPGLKLEDLQNIEDWGYMTKYLYMASTLVSIPWVDQPLDLKHLEKYIVKTCKAETINVWLDESEVNYIDVRTRVISVELKGLPEDKEQRLVVVRQNDELLRKILRKLPSPHYTFIITSDKTSDNHFVPDIIKELHPEKFHIFHDITHDPKREFEVERNDRFHKPEPNFATPRHTNDRYLKNKQIDEIHLFNLDLWKKNEKLVMTIFLMIGAVIFMKFTEFVSYVKTNLGAKKKNKGPIIKQD